MTTHQKYLKIIQKELASFDVYVVGGAVRDRILKKKVWDYDFVLRFNPVQLAKTLSNKIKGTSFVLDKDRAVYRISHPSGLQIDLSQIQGSSFHKDLDRRDFTVNALAVPLKAWFSPNWKKEIIDRHNGLFAIKKKQIKAVSLSVLKEDPLRILRAFRFSAELGFQINPQTIHGMKAIVRLIKKSAPERIREELLKLFCSSKSYPIIKKMDEVRLWDVLLPEVQLMRKIGHRYYGRGGVLTHTFDAIKHLESIIQEIKTWFPRCHRKIEKYLQENQNGYPRYAHLKWGTLLHDIGKPKTAKIIKGRLRFFDHEHIGAKIVLKLAERYRWSSSEKGRYSTYVRHHMRPGNLASHENLTDKALHRFFRDLGEEAIGMLLVSLGDHLTYLTPTELKKRKTRHELITIKMVNLFYQNKNKILPPKILNGHDVMKTFGLKPSPIIGELLAKAQEAQSEGKIKSKEEGLIYLKTQIDQLKIPTA